jgi:hypothetical protein
MNRVMMLVLPTDWSPKNTSLYFAKAETGAIFESNDDYKIEAEDKKKKTRKTPDFGLISLAGGD